MKILFFNYFWNNKGGNAVQFRKMTDSLRNLGHDVRECFLRFGEQKTAEIGVSTKVKRPFRRKLGKYLYELRELASNLRFLRSELEIIKRENPDIIISRLECCIFSSIVSARTKKIPIVLFADGLPTYEAKLLTDYWHIPLLPDFLEKKAMKHSNAVVTISNEAKKYLTEVTGILSKNVFVVPNGVDVEKFQPKSKEEIDRLQIAQMGKITIGFAGGFLKIHDIEALKMLIMELSKKREDVSFLLIGEGEERGKLVNYLRENNILHRVTFTGHIDHELVPYYISAMDIAIAPYPQLDFWYNSPMKVLEYMACSRALVATNQGQVSEIIQDGKNGFVYNPGNYAEMLKKVERLIEDGDLRRELGENARKTVCQEYTWDKCGQRIQEVVESVLKHRHN
jgi:glycosyltransferase involved in cell wall biosynthesis